MKALPKTLAATGFAVSALLFAPASGLGAEQVRLRARRDLRHERDGLGASLLGAGLRGLQAGGHGDGLRGGLLGHARLRHHQADRLVRAGSGARARRASCCTRCRPTRSSSRSTAPSTAASPIVTFAADSPNSKRTSYITSDNLAEAKFAAEEIAKLLGGKGEYAVLENPGQSNHDLRVTAFIAYMEENFPEMKLVGRQASNQDSNKAYQAVQAMLQANPNLGALWIPEAGSAEGAVAAVLEAKADVVIMHADVTPTTLEHIKAGNIHMALNPNQGMQGYMGFLATFMAAHPDLIDPFNDYKRSGYNPMGIPFIDNGFAVITKENADDFDLNVYMEGRG